LRLLLTSNAKLTVGLFDGFALFAFGDAFLVRGKVDGRRDLAGSWIGGGGLQFSRVIKL
jgi:hypothetical protein